MGNFVGHVLPGSFFLLFALWWLIQLNRRRAICGKHGIPFFNSGYFPVGRGRLARCPLEPIVMLVATSIGMVGELIASTDFFRAGRIVFLGDIQHVTMYGLFALLGVFNLLRHCNRTPQGAEYLIGIIAFLGEALLFHFHNSAGSMDPLEMLVHTLLVMVIVACAFAVAAEFYFRESLLAGLTRIYFVLFQGTWFIQIAFILFPPAGGYPWGQGHGLGKDETFKLIVIVFCWHAIINIIIVSLVSAFAYSAYTKWLAPKTTDSVYEITISMAPCRNQNTDKSYGLLEEESEQEA